MKKIILLLSLTVVTSAIKNAHSSKAVQSHSMYASGVPEAVMATFDNTVNDLMSNWYPSNPSYDASGVSWGRYKGEWQCSGFVAQQNGNGAGLNVIIGKFKNTGEFISLNYTVQQ